MLLGVWPRGTPCGDWNCCKNTDTQILDDLLDRLNDLGPHHCRYERLCDRAVFIQIPHPENVIYVRHLLQTRICPMCVRSRCFSNAVTMVERCDPMGAGDTSSTFSPPCSFPPGSSLFISPGKTYLAPGMSIYKFTVRAYFHVNGVPNPLHGWSSPTSLHNVSEN